MLKISNTKIFITRGDSAYIDINISNPDGSKYELQDGDSIQCQVRTAANTGMLLINASTDNEKLYVDDDGAVVWHISPEDTRGLDIGTYCYDVQLTTAVGDVFTFIDNSVFKVTDEVTWHE